MLLFLFLFGLLLSAVFPSVKLQHGNCTNSEHSFNGRCYKYVATAMTWADAELHCVSEGTNLVSIHSLKEQNFVKALVKKFNQAERHIWIGLSDTHKQGRWMWSDGSAVYFVFWNVGEPNNAGGNEHCVHGTLSLDMKWNDLLCSQTFAFVCASHPICP
uniref:C-type lectin domain-containing protein n=2 Tax=Monopterus albus TaxID=43700 RepID=A0A3Q3KAZ2_MONAL